MSTNQTLRAVPQTSVTPTPDPSTYRQVLKNMRSIAELLADIESLGAGGSSPEGTKLSEIIKELQRRVKELEDQLGGEADSDLLTMINAVIARLTKIESTITEPTGPKDVVTTSNGNKVLGVHVNVINSEKNTLINEYQQGVTWEFKNIAAIGATGLEGMSGTHCTVMTIKQDSLLAGEREVNARPSQIAYSTTGVFFYRRYPKADGTWGPWEEQEEYHFQIVESNTPPEGQLPGEFWMQPLGVETVSEYWTELISRDEANPSGEAPNGSLIADDRNDADYTLETLS